MKGHAQQCVEMCCVWENKSVSQLKQATLCIDDRQLMKILKSLVNLLRFPKKIMLKCFYRAGIGRPVAKWTAWSKIGKIEEVYSLHTR